MKIIGVRDEKAKPLYPSLFGTERGDKYINRRNSFCLRYVNLDSKRKFKLEVRLAVVPIDLSVLLTPFWDYKEKASFHNPNDVLMQRVNMSYILRDMFLLSEINLRPCFTLKNKSPLTKSLLNERMTTLKVDAYLTSMMKTLIPNYENERIYKRIFLIAKNKTAASEIFNSCLKFNIKKCGISGLWNYVKLPTRNRDPKLPEDMEIGNYPNIITGFFFDNGEDGALFIEGPSDGYIRKVWTHLSNRESSLRIFYNDEHVFKERLYSQFVNYSGLLWINSIISFPLILTKPGIYLKGNVPLPCFQVSPI